MKTLIKNAVLTDASGSREGSLLIQDGKISKIYKPDARIRAKYDNEIDAQGMTLMPGMVDMHCHLRDPGLTYKEDIHTGLMAAAKGGFTTVTAMGNTIPVTDSAEKVHDIKERAEKEGLSDLIQVCTLTRNFGDDQCVDFESVARETHALSNDGHNVDNADRMAEGLKASDQYDFILMCHEEPETETVIRDIGLLRENGGHLHICHISKKDTLDAISAARDEGLDITCEVTPHHLYASGMDYRVHPPFRTWNDRRALIEGCADGRIDAFGTDHAPHSAEDKAAGSPGINNFETAFAMYHTVFKNAGIPLARFSEMASAAPAKRLGLKTGMLKEGWPADLILAAPDEEWKVEPDKFVSKSRNTPFGGDWLSGRIHKTFKDGQVIYDLDAEEHFTPKKMEAAVKPEPAKAETAVEPEAPAKAETTVKPETPAKAETAVEPEAPAKAETTDKTEAAAKAEPEKAEPAAAEKKAGTKAPASKKQPARRPRRPRKGSSKKAPAKTRPAANHSAGAAAPVKTEKNGADKADTEPKKSAEDK